MAGQKTISSTFEFPPEPPPPPPPPDYQVTGDSNPDVNGDYNFSGIFDGNPSYSRLDNAYHLWYSLFASRWIINANKGVFLAWYFRSQTDNIVETYDPIGIAAGEAIVAVGV